MSNSLPDENPEDITIYSQSYVFSKLNHGPEIIEGQEWLKVKYGILFPVNPEEGLFHDVFLLHITIDRVLINDEMFNHVLEACVKGSELIRNKYGNNDKVIRVIAASEYRDSEDIIKFPNRQDVRSRVLNLAKECFVKHKVILSGQIDILPIESEFFKRLDSRISGSVRRIFGPLISSLRPYGGIKVIYGYEDLDDVVKEVYVKILKVEAKNKPEQ